MSKRIKHSGPKLVVPLFNSGLVLLCTEWSEYESLCKQMRIEVGEPCNGLSRTYSRDRDTVHILGVFNGNLGTLAHECSHIAFDICHQVGVPTPAGEANETFCYLVGTLFRFGHKHIGGY